MKTLIIVVALLASSMLLLSSSTAYTQSYRDIIRGYSSRKEVPAKDPVWSYPSRRRTRTRTECYVSRHKYVWHGNKVVKVPVTTCEEKY